MRVREFGRGVAVRHAQAEVKVKQTERGP